MIDCKINDPSLLSKVIELMSHFTDLVNFVVSSSSLFIHAVDHSKVVLFEFKLLENQAFIFVNKDQTKRIKLSSFEKHYGINLKIFSQVTKGLKSDDSLNIQFPSNDEGEITLHIKKKNPLRKFTYQLSQFEICDSESYEINNFEEQARVEILMNTQNFSQMIQDLHHLNGHRFRIQIEKRDDFVLTLKTWNEFIKASIDISNNGEESVSISVSEREEEFVTIGNEYPFKILSVISRASKISDQVLFQVCENGPLGILYGLDGGSFQFFVAPFIPNDDSEDE